MKTAAWMPGGWITGACLAGALAAFPACSTKGFSEGYSAYKPAEMAVEALDSCSLSKPAVRAPAELMLSVEQTPYTASRIALARSGDVAEVDISQTAVKALDSEAAALANQVIPPLTDAFDVVIPVPDGYQPEPGQLVGRLRYESAPVHSSQLPVLSASDSFLALEYQFVQIAVQLRLIRDGKPLGDIRASGLAYRKASSDRLEPAIRESADLTATALCRAMRQLVVKLRRSDTFVTLGGPRLFPETVQAAPELVTDPAVAPAASSTPAPAKPAETEKPPTPKP